MAISCGFKGNSNSSKHVVLLQIVLLFSAKACCDDHPHASKRINCFENERRALLAIKSDLYNSNHWLSSWIGNDCCKWRGIVCDNTTNHVTRLDLHYPLDQYALLLNKSKMNPSLFKLKHLKYLDLSFNDFSTHIPSMISSLIHLQHLNLSCANFNGLIPLQLGNLSSLRILDLNSCDMFSSLWSNDLSWLSHLTSLEYLDMSGVNLSLANRWIHQINYNSLEHLDLSYCGLQDTIGVDKTMTEVNASSNQMEENIFMNATRKLKHLDLNVNSLTKFPLVVGSFIQLEYLDLCENQFTGRIPLSIGNLIHMIYLDLSFNDFTEGIPSSMGNLIYLKHLDLSRNDFTEGIPSSMGNLIYLKYLDLSNNHFTEGIPSSMGNLICLKYLYLHDNLITGELPFSVGNLTNLIHLEMQFNEFYGNIPDALGNLTSLIYLDMSFNEFSGITNALCNLIYLEDLLLNGNNISGQIPRNIGRLHNLRNFDASMNNLMGQIPLSLGDLCNLEDLDLYQNNIGGELTNLLDGLSKCPQGSKLWSLSIYDNKLSGLAPSNLWQLAQLESMDISSNSLRGNMTDAHFSKLTNLLYLDISYNSLNLIFSDDWLPPFQARSIDMSYCYLGARFPSWIQTQTNLAELYLSGVGLYGNIPSWFSDFILKNSNIDLDVSSNNLSGQLPSSISISMDLSKNSFEGAIPLSYAKFKQVSVLKLSNNHIHGSLPASFCNLSDLRVLHLSNNYLSGEVPNCHGSYPIRLLSLHMNNNNLSGPFPPALRNSKGLIVLDLSGNKFSGAIPKWVGRSFPVLKFLSLSSNSFRGAIPVSIGDLTFLQVLDLSSNKFIGSIPSAIANFNSMSVKQNYSNYLEFSCIYFNFQGDSCSFMEYFIDDNNLITAKGSTNVYTKALNGDMLYFLDDNILISAKGSTIVYTIALSAVASIDLSNNELSGEIPKEITKLHGLCFLNLSNNHFTGRIPENIGAITELESLDLSMNHLTGEIPFNLSSLTFLCFLNLSYNNLSGRIPTGGQFSTFDDSIYAGNKGLCGVPLARCPGDDANQPPSPIGENEDGDKLETILNYTFIVMGFIAGFWAYFGMIIMKKSIKVALFQVVDDMYDWMYVQLSLKIAKLNMKWQK